MDTSPVSVAGEEAAKGTSGGKSVSFSSKLEGITEKEEEEKAEEEKMDTVEGEKATGGKVEDGGKEGKEGKDGKGEAKEGGEGKEGKAEEKEPEPDFETLSNPARVLMQQVCTNVYHTAVLPIWEGFQLPW